MRYCLIGFNKGLGMYGTLEKYGKLSRLLLIIDISIVYMCEKKTLNDMVQIFEINVLPYLTIFDR